MKELTKEEYWMDGDERVSLDIIRILHENESRKNRVPKHINAYLKNLYTNTILMIEWAHEDNYNSLEMIIVAEGYGYVYGSLNSEVMQAGITFMCENFGMEEEEFEVRGN